MNSSHNSDRVAATVQSTIAPTTSTSTSTTTTPTINQRSISSDLAASIASSAAAAGSAASSLTGSISASSSNRTGVAGGLSQFVNDIDINNIIQSNTFLHSDLSNFINISANNNSNLNSSNQLLSRSNNSNNQMSWNSNSNRTYQQLNNSNINNSSYHNHSHSHSHAHPYQTHSNSSHFNESSLANINNETLNNVDQVVLNLQSNQNSIAANANGTSTNSNDADMLNQQQQQQQQQADQSGANNFFLFLIKTMQSSLPFFLIVVAKIFHQHLTGFLVVLGFMTTLHWSNRTLVHQVELKDKKQNLKLLLLILFLLLNVAVFFFIFKDYRLHNCLIFLSTNIHKMDTWNLIWIVVCSDTIIKFLIISIKAMITILPFSIMPLRKRGNYYSTIETFALFYRSLTPIYPWLLFLMYSDTNLQILKQDTTSPNEQVVKQESGNSTVFSIILCVIYMICKLNQLYNRFIELTQSFRELVRDTTYGIPVTLNENEENICPICQDKLSSPVILKCRHTFCQDCVCVWLDKENSCPMCRARVSIKKPIFKDGSTTIFIQWF